MQYPLHDGVKGDSMPVGYVRLPDEIEAEQIQNAYILPLLRYTGEGLEIVSFVLVQTPAEPAS